MLVILSKLVTGADDRAWIDRVRLAHDPHYAVVGPHFTLVFPFAGLSVEEVTRHAEAVAATTSAVRFRLSRAAAVRDAFAPRSHVFLLPTEGEYRLRQLHRRLYSGVLAPKLHPEIPFVPHVTVGAFDQHEDAERLAGSLEPFEMEGDLHEMELADFDGKAVTELRRFRFGRR
jgi:2'-5' RNA ligase